MNYKCTLITVQQYYQISLFTTLLNNYFMSFFSNLYLSLIPALSWWPFCFTNTSKQKSTTSSHYHFYPLSCDHILCLLCYNEWNAHVHRPKATSSTCIKIFQLLLPTLEHSYLHHFFSSLVDHSQKHAVIFPIRKKNALLISFSPPVSFPFLCDPL